MRRERVLAGLTGLFLFAAGAAHGQTPAGEDPSREVFETATVKHFTLTTDLLFIGTHGGPGTRNPGRITYEAMNIPELLVLAYGVKSYLISDPAIHQERYVIEATIRKDATKQQVNQMLQNLLAERFKLALHRETEDRPLYEMVVAETGSKLKRFMPTQRGLHRGIHLRRSQAFACGTSEYHARHGFGLPRRMAWDLSDTARPARGLAAYGRETNDVAVGRLFEHRIRPSGVGQDRSQRQV